MLCEPRPSSRPIHIWRVSLDTIGQAHVVWAETIERAHPYLQGVAQCNRAGPYHPCWDYWGGGEGHLSVETIGHACVAWVHHYHGRGWPPIITRADNTNQHILGFFSQVLSLVPNVHEDSVEDGIFIEQFSLTHLPWPLNTVIVRSAPTGNWCLPTMLRNIWLHISGPLSVTQCKSQRKDVTTHWVLKDFVKQIGWLISFYRCTVTRVCSPFSTYYLPSYNIPVVIQDANMLWLAERAGNYMTSHLEVVDPTQLQEDFPNATELDFHSDPAVIVDQSDNIALWYLLTTVSGPNQVC